MFAISKSSNAGATSRPAPSFSATNAASGSPNSKAASAEASTTLTAISIVADDRRSFGGRLQAETAYLGQNLIGRQLPGRPDSLLDDRQEFPLKRTMMARRPGTQPLDHFVRCILD
jgi:hypothetical protein